MSGQRAGTASPAAPRRVAVVTALLVALVAGQSSYRAATQSITHDEACTYNWFVVRPANLFNYDTNNHVLFTYTAMATVAVLGPSELALRLPTVVAAAGFALAVLLLLRRALPAAGWFELAALATLSNPLVLDYLTAARGYGLALALLFSALAAGVRIAARQAPPAGLATDLTAISLLLGLSVAASLAFSFAAAAVALAVGAMTVTRARRAPVDRFAAAREAAARLCLPGAAVAFLLYLPFAVKVGVSHALARSPSLLAAAHRLDPGIVPPDAPGTLPVLPPGVVLVASGAVVAALLAVVLALATAARYARRRHAGRARWLAPGLAALLIVTAAGLAVPAAGRLVPRLARGYLYTGATDLGSATCAMFAANLARHRPSTQERTLPAVEASPLARAAANVAAVGALLLLAVPLGIAWRRRLSSGGARPSTPEGVGALLLSSVLVVTALLYLAAHLLVGINLPPPRAAVFVPPLATVAGALVLATLRPRARVVAPLAFLAAIALLARYAQQYDPRVFWGNLADAGSRELFAHLEAVASSRSPASVRVGGSWVHEPSMNFYRQTRHAAWMAPYTRDDASDPSVYDFLISDAAPAAALRERGFVEVYREPIGGITLARRVARGGGEGSP
jgi:hypothetical protein